MKSILLFIALAANIAPCVAQDKIPAEKVSNISHKLIENLGDLTDAQVKIEPNADKSDGFTVDGSGVIVVPDKNFSSAALEKAGARILPVGHLFLKDIAPAKNGKVAPADLLRRVTLTDRGEELKITDLLLGIRKQDEQLELAVYGKEDTPLLQLPLHKLEGKTQTLPVEVSGERQDDDSGMITLGILGQYKAMLLVKRAEG